MHDLYFPEMALVRQQLIRSRIDDPVSALQKSLGSISDRLWINKKDTVAVAVGSRKIDRLHRVAGACIDFLKDLGARPFILPAMGSHGGATAEGQKNILADLKITPEEMGVPILAHMDTDRIGAMEGLDLYVSKAALAADHIVVINRIKPHTKFGASIESGLCKMLTVGLGKADGAAEFHRAAIKGSFCVIEDAARFLLNRLQVLFCVGLVEDGCGQLSRISVMLPDGLIDEEKRLLAESKKMMPRIPFDHLGLA